jgi:serine/threonine protein kinase
MANKTLQPGNTLQGGKYRIEKVLGQGSFGITYLASYATTIEGALGKMAVDIKVAIKEFFMSEVNQRNEQTHGVEGSSSTIFTNYRIKFRKEAQNLASLHHPHIVQVTDVFDENNTTYYVMQYIEGMSLDSFIASKGRVSAEDTILIAAQIGQALSYMHQRHMLHLDLKPGNIMLDKQGQVHLIDFGLSKQYDSNGEPESSTSIGMGTPGYAPIEQGNRMGQGKQFQATIDVYAFGATVYKMLTGRRPDDASVILNDGFPFGFLQQLGVQQNMINAVQRAMAPQRNARFQTVTEFVQALDDGRTIPYSAPDFTLVDDNTITASSEPTRPIRPSRPSQPSSATQSPNDEELAPSTSKLAMKQIMVVLCVCIAAAMVLFLAMGKFGSADGNLSKDTEYADSDSVAYYDDAEADTCAVDSCASVDDEYMY